MNLSFMMFPSLLSFQDSHSQSDIELQAIVVADRTVCLDVLEV